MDTRFFLVDPFKNGLLLAVVIAGTRARIAVAQDLSPLSEYRTIHRAVEALFGSMDDSQLTRLGLP